MIKSLSLPSFLQPMRQPTVSAKSLGRRPSFAARPQQSQKFFFASVALIAANMVLMATYFVGVNTYAGKGYEIRNLQNKLAALTEDQKKLNLKIAEQSSVLSLQTDFTNARYVPVTGATFLQVNQLSYGK